jgi:hypothetical protein
VLGGPRGDECDGAGIGIIDGIIISLSILETCGSGNCVLEVIQAHFYSDKKKKK